MGCGQCASGGCGSIRLVDNNERTNHITVRGCQSRGTCGTSGCNKLNAFDWLADMDTSTTRYDVVEIKFKGGRKEYFRNTEKLELYTGDFVVCEMPTGFHIGSVSLQGELVRLQLIKRNISDSGEMPKILRIANEKDLDKHEQAINRDLPTMYRTREIVRELGLQMKLSDVEYQSDNTKATFFYSAEERVDFRELIKLLAGEFKIRVEMRQISLRQEASRLGGIGSCGRELCCSTWLTDFKGIPTAAARYQNLSLNPAKLSGQCGRLKCCLNYELETYVDALRDIPQVEKPILTEKGEAYLQKTDIFRRLMWFSYKNDSNWHPITCQQVIEVQAMNAEGIKPVSLTELSPQELVESKPGINRDLAQLDKKFTDKRSDNRKAGKKKKPSGNRPAGAEGASPQASAQRPAQNASGSESTPRLERQSGQRSHHQRNANDRSRNTENRGENSRNENSRNENSRNDNSRNDNSRNEQSQTGQSQTGQPRAEHPQGEQRRPNNHRRRGGNRPPKPKE